MIIKKIDEIESQKVDMAGVKDVNLKMLIGPNDGSINIAMRKFEVLPGGHTPKHSHNYEHVVKVEKNKGLFLDKNGTTHEIKEGDCMLVPASDEHQFQNPYNEPFEFLCIILNQK